MYKTLHFYYTFSLSKDDGYKIVPPRKSSPAGVTIHIIEMVDLYTFNDDLQAMTVSSLHTTIAYWIYKENFPIYQMSLLRVTCKFT